MTYRIALVSAVFLFACGDDSGTTPQPDVQTADVPPEDTGSADAPSADTPNADVPTTECDAVEPEVVQFTTEDGVMLEGDLYDTGIAGGAAAVLLHMIPPSNTRANFPREFIDDLTTRCITVLNIDRRGAGGSGGVAAEAYTGPNGALDAKGATEFLLARANPPSAERFVLVGASNGTTTVIDFSEYSKRSRTVAPPAALVLLSPGGYTENQFQLSETDVVEVPTLFAFPVSERDWNVAQMDGAPARWVFNEYDPGAHGTGLFQANPESVSEVASFIETAITP